MSEDINKIFSEYIKPIDDRKIPLSMIDHDVCKICGGLCCKNLGCYISPNDFKTLDINTVSSFISKGFVSIDWWEPTEETGYKRLYFLRMRNKGAPIVDPSFGGRCIAHSDKGCAIEDVFRPSGGLMLIPSESEECLEVYPKIECAKEWRPYRDMLEELAVKFKETGNSRW